jgi:exopolysaccharide biosynthesis polyprenyl glycosylphosphotransferase
MPVVTHAGVLRQLIDAVFADAAIVAVLVLANVGLDTGGLERFVTTRITLTNAILTALFVVIYHLTFNLAGVYATPPAEEFARKARKITVAVSCSTVFVCAFPALSKTGAFGWSLVPCCWALVMTGALSIAGISHIMGVLRRGRLQREVLIVGSGPLALRASESLLRDHGSDVRLLGFVDSPVGHHVPEYIRRNLIGGMEDLNRLLMTRVVDTVIIALPMKSCYDEIQRTIAACEAAGVTSEFLPQVFRVSVARPRVSMTGVGPNLSLSVVDDDYRLDIKRALDIVGAISGLVVLAPLMIAIAFALRISGPGPVLFIQQRFGLNKRRFPMLKFRTMELDAEVRQLELETQNEAHGPVFKIRNDPRITSVGRFLRKTSLDELPQLINVLRGEMSLVGPRPLPLRDVSRFDAPYLMRRFSVKPGLTCLWQISGRCNTTFDEWIRQDLAYIDNWSLVLDLIILARTLPAVLRGTGAV